MHPRATITDGPLTQIDCDALVVGAFSSDNGPLIADGGSELNTALDGYLGELGGLGFKAGIGEVMLVPTFKRISPRLVAVVGLGPEKKLTRATICSAAAVAAKRLRNSPVLVSLLHLALPDRAEGARAAVEGFALGTYRFDHYKSEPRPSKIAEVQYPDADENAIELGTIAAEAATLARDLINEPPSTLTPKEFADRARSIAESSGLDCKIMEEDELRERGFGGLLATASGSDQPPRLIQLTYTPESPTETIALVGKGVTFDSGGLALKPIAGMELMKTDMAGGAAVVAIMSGLKRLGLRCKVEAVIPTTENMTGGSAMRPGDVIRHYGGKTTEVINPDAEGRLILADALAYASELHPAAMVDVATLTGSMTVAIGKKASGLFASDDSLREEILGAAEAVGERTWPFPLYEDYLAELDSEVADHKNSGIRWGGAIIAAMFLKQFVGDGVAWAHMDIAGTGRSERDYLEISKGGTGIPVRTLLEWLRTRSG